MQDDFRFVHREESFEDLAVRELAKSRSACMCRLQFGRCTRDECKTCQVNQRFQRCWNQMSDYDKQRTQSYTAQLYAERSVDPMQWSSFAGCIKYVLFIFGVIAFAGIALVMLVSSIGDPSAEPSAISIPAELDERIIPVMVMTHSQVKDINGDGKVNCIDYTCTFKHLWDSMYPNRKNECNIVRNYNPKTGFHHLFIRVYGSTRSVYVEPRAKNPYRYTMEENWTDGRYDPKHDILGETDRWMNMYEAF